MCPSAYGCCVSDQLTVQTGIEPLRQPRRRAQSFRTWHNIGLLATRLPKFSPSRTAPHATSPFAHQQIDRIFSRTSFIKAPRNCSSNWGLRNRVRSVSRSSKRSRVYERSCRNLSAVVLFLVQHHDICNPIPTITQTGRLPGGVKFTDNRDGTASLSGRPGNGQGLVGDYALVLTASNGVNPAATQNFTLTISNPPRIVSAITLLLWSARPIVLRSRRRRRFRNPR